tara:strand:+ start:52 stop:417 length:366 start_codon:yes stop_codon:yes gene_type:complete
MAKKTLKIESQSIPLLFLLAIVPLLIAVLNQFGVIDLTVYTGSLLTILGGLFVASEIGLMGMLRKRKLGKDPLRIFGALVVTVAIITAGLSLFGMSIGILNPILGIVNTLVIVYIVVEAFR